MAENSTSNDLKDKLDELILEGLNVFEELLEEHRQLEQALREGFSLISKARYSMGSRSVGILQLPTEDGREVEALVRVDHTNNAVVKGMDFFVACQNGQNETNDATEQDILRKRLITKSSGAESAKEYQLRNHKVADCDVPFDKKNDPLKWFGVLVPQALRSSQSIFRQNINSVCRIASLRSQLESIRKEYKQINSELAAISFERLKAN